MNGKDPNGPARPRGVPSRWLAGSMIAGCVIGFAAGCASQATTMSRRGTDVATSPVFSDESAALPFVVHASDGPTNDGHTDDRHDNERADQGPAQGQQSHEPPAKLIPVGLAKPLLPRETNESNEPIEPIEPNEPIEQTAEATAQTAAPPYDPHSEPTATAETVVASDLAQLEAEALTRNPVLQQMQQQYAAARAKVGYVDGLPDPRLGGNVFVAPIETAAGAQRANLTLSQAIPWLERLDAKRQQACLEAMAVQQRVRAERLKIVADVRTLWYRLYLIDRQTEISTASQQLVRELMDVANARVSTGQAAQGDVLAGTLEYSRVEERLLTLRQQRQSVEAELNRTLGRPADVAVVVPRELSVALPDWNHAQLRSQAFVHQPRIQSARIHAQATRWGIEVARLQRRPDFSVSASWFEIDSNRPQPGIVDIGEDAWSLGASLSIPLWEKKYDALENEAQWQHAAAHAGVQQLQQQFDAQLRDLWQQAVTASETAALYQNTILPQANDTLRADQQSYVTGGVEFDRVIRDCRDLLMLQTGYHRAIAQLASSLARIEQAVGQPLR